jgi:hypothetical protein
LSLGCAWCEQQEEKALCERIPDERVGEK